LKGYDCCIGNASLLNNPRTDDCTLVTLLRQLGAIPFCYTNVPQTLISFACSNPVYGTTKNGHNLSRWFQFFYLLIKLMKNNVIN
jgi:fatty acid amide hydrolase